MFGHEGKNSLYSILKEEGLITSLGCHSEHDMRVMTSFLVTVELTEKGFKLRNKVIEYVHAYIKMLKEKGINKRVFEEIKAKKNL